MIQATGNNFGCADIRLDDFQNEKQVVLNGKFSFPCRSAQFMDAQVLEVYVPDLSIPASGISGCYITAEIDGSCYSTTIRTWIRDRNTICFEKLDPWSDNADTYTVILLSLYVPKGQRKQFTCGTRQTLTPLFQNTSNRFSEKICYVDNNWALLALSYSSYSRAGENVEEVITLEGLPEDIDTQIPFIADDTNCAYPGAPTVLCTIQDSTLTVPPLPFGSWSGMPKKNFLYGVLLRSRQTPDPQEQP